MHEGRVSATYPPDQQSPQYLRMRADAAERLCLSKRVGSCVGSCRDIVLPGLGIPLSSLGDGTGCLRDIPRPCLTAAVDQA